MHVSSKSKTLYISNDRSQDVFVTSDRVTRGALDSSHSDCIFLLSRQMDRVKDTYN